MIHKLKLPEESSIVHRIINIYVSIICTFEQSIYFDSIQFNSKCESIRENFFFVHYFQNMYFILF